jgi:hypothetical protein
MSSVAIRFTVKNLTFHPQNLLMGFASFSKQTMIIWLKKLSVGLRNVEAECVLGGTNSVYIIWISYKVALGQGFLLVLRFFLASIMPATLHNELHRTDMYVLPELHATQHSAQACGYQDSMKRGRVRPCAV